MDEDEMVVTESEDSNDSWTTEEFSSEFIMRYGSRFVDIYLNTQVAIILGIKEILCLHLL